MKLKTLNKLNKILIDIKLKDIKNYKIAITYHNNIIETDNEIKQDIKKLIESL